MRISGNDPDNWPAVWLMPVQHNGIADQYPGNPPGFEQWMELDVNEGGFGPGLTGTVHSWSGIWPNNTSLTNSNNVDSTPLDATQVHTFGASYNPTTQTVAWWVDGVEQMTAGAPDVPAIAAQQDFYLLLTAASHGDNDPYTMYVSGVRAFEAPISAPEPSGLALACAGLIGWLACGRRLNNCWRRRMIRR